MLFADRVPIVNTHSNMRRPKRVLPIPRSTLSGLRHHVLANSFKLQTPSSLPGLTSLNRFGFDATVGAVGMSAKCRFCCKSPLRAFLVSDSVAVRRFATGAGYDGAADTRPGTVFL